jgi:hypothetical protein
MRLLYRLEVKKIDEILQKRFKLEVYNEESKKHADTIPFNSMSDIMHTTSWLSPKETKLILRQYAIKYGSEEVDYSRFAEDLHMARYELAKCRIMDTSIDQIGPSLLDSFKKIDAEQAKEAAESGAPYKEGCISV